MSTKPTLRRDITKLEPQELDRFMIALHLLETTDPARVSLRRLAGLHGGGSGTTDGASNDILKTKAALDLNNNVGGDHTSAEAGEQWPDLEWKNVTPETLTDANAFTAHTYCWHGTEIFFVWHRPFMLEFEALLRSVDPAPTKDIALHYWKWDEWDGTQAGLPPTISQRKYTIQTDSYPPFKKGQQIDSPLYRWYAPSNTSDQLHGTFPGPVTDTNCSCRDAPFDDLSQSKKYTQPWNAARVQSVIKNGTTVSSWPKFATVGSRSTVSLEGPHNSLHMRVAGYDGANRIGTMGSLQSPFDPIFWVHHSNIERFLLSWQRVWYKDDKPQAADSQPSKETMSTVLYPWTKPSLTYQGKFSYNTPADRSNDGTFADWFSIASLPYAYDEYISAPSKPALRLMAAPIRGVAVGGAPNAVKIIASVKTQPLKSGTLVLSHNGVDIDEVTILSGTGGSCAKCKQRTHHTLAFDVTGKLTPGVPVLGLRLSTVVGDERIDVPIVGVSVEPEHHIDHVKDSRGTCFGKNHSFQADALSFAVVGGTAAEQSALETAVDAVLSKASPKVPTQWRVKGELRGSHATQTPPNVIVARTALDGPGHVWVHTSHEKAGEAHAAFSTVTSLAPAASGSRLWLYVSESVPAEALDTVVKHLIEEHVFFHAAAGAASHECPYFF